MSPSPRSRLAAGAALLGVVAAAATLERRRRRESPPAVLSGRATRTAELARLGSRAGVGLAVNTARSAFASEERRAELRSDYELRTAAQVVESLGHMKGAVMKLGQMASYLDQGLPEPVREALAQLRTAAPPMAPELVEQVVEAELGGSPRSVFASWSEHPVAAASIGQVHRATTHDGREVAVKVQYPGVDDAIRADLDNSDLLFGALGMLFPGLDPKPLVEELRARLVEELDYRVEAANQRRFALEYDGHPTIHVPMPLEEWSTARVLTTEFVEGATFEQLQTWSQEERDLAAETIYRFVFGGVYDLGVFNGDPHPGNYVFHGNGRVTFLDFGLCKVFTTEEVEWFKRMTTTAILDDDREAFFRLVEEIGLIPNVAALDADLVMEYFHHFYELVLRDEPMTVTSEYAAESLRRFFDLNGPYGDIIKAANLPPAMVIIQRINLGVFSVLAELGATRNWRAIAEELWPFVAREPTTPMGHDIAAWRMTHPRGPR